MGVIGLSSIVGEVNRFLTPKLNPCQPRSNSVTTMVNSGISSYNIIRGYYIDYEQGITLPNLRSHSEHMRESMTIDPECVVEDG